MHPDHRLSRPGLGRVLAPLAALGVAVALLVVTSAAAASTAGASSTRALAAGRKLLAGRIIGIDPGHLTGLGPPLLSGGTLKATRMITLNEVEAGTPAWRLNLNAGPYGGPDSVTETLTWNNVEDWYFVNLTADTHPMHTHLFSFKVMGRYNLDTKGFVAAFGGANGVPQKDVATLAPFLKSKLMPPDPTEAGLKETVKANPGQVTVVRAKFIPPSTASVGGQLTEQKYVHHCHIVEHEDNDMMERVLVQP